MNEVKGSSPITELGKCNELWVFGKNITNGMQMEIDKARKRHMTIRYFTEEMEEVEPCN